METKPIEKELIKPDGFETIICKNVSVDLMNKIINFDLITGKQVTFSSLYTYISKVLPSDMKIYNWDETTEFDFCSTHDYYFEFKFEREIPFLPVGNFSKYVLMYSLRNFVIDIFGFSIA